ncbi:hypothetical protein BKK54_03710 [Rodentibacter genomosp. 1]|uniref:Uncharacterized protein n=1 Tax=Rodentibacter genomosp. 1 TaxID=1908264 RepID=A0A1V3J7S7_9PAST|nr:hypothetical protein BKK54_03710 [Rodentibacter genomosp. 1]
MARNFLKKFTDSYIQSIKPTDKEQLFADRDNLYLFAPHKQKMRKKIFWGLSLFLLNFGT